MSTPKTFWALAQEWRESVNAHFDHSATKHAKNECALQLEALIREWANTLDGEYSEGFIELVMLGGAEKP